MPRDYVRLQTFHREVPAAHRWLRVSSHAPILGLIAVSIAAALAIAAGFGGAVGMSLHAFMGFFLCSHAMLNLFDLSRFANGFARFDLIATRWRGYGFVFPFLQLGLGLGFFSYVAPVQIYFATAILFTFTLAGVLSARHRGLDLASTDTPTALRAPLGVVTLVESALMTVLVMVLMWM